MLTRAEIARKADEAAHLIETMGWFKQSDGQNVMFPVEGSRRCHCPMTAFPYYRLDDVVEAFARFLGWRYSANPMRLTASDYIIAWNDSQNNAETVIKALREFAAKMREKDSINVAA